MVPVLLTDLADGANKTCTFKVKVSEELSHDLKRLRNSHPVPLAGSRFGSTEYLYVD
jgi:hypothetical protein